MKLSLLMCTYNGSKYIVDQLLSILEQSRQPDEVVIIDDLSLDNTVEIATNFIKDNSLSDTWKIYVNECNKGWIRNFIDGIEKTTGDILFFCDQDDIWFKDKIRVQAEIIENNDNVSVVASPEISKYNDKKSYRVSNDFKILDVCKNPKNYLNIMNGCSMAVRRSFYDSVKEYWIDGWAHDQFIWQMALINDTLAVMMLPTLYRRLHDKNASRKKRTLESTILECHSFIAALRQILRYLKADSNSVALADQKLFITNERIRAIEKRLLLLEHKKISVIPLLLRDRYCIYWRKRQVLKDILLALKLL